MDKDLLKIAEKTLEILNKKSWDNFSIDSLYKKIKLNKSKNKILSKNELLKNINRYLDFLLESNSRFIEKSSKKDMLFEIIMMRFDLLQNNRKSIISIINSLKKKPKESIFLLPSFLESMIIIANLAEIKTSGLIGNLKIKALFIVYFSTFLVWLKDDNESLNKTMTALDKYLDSAEKLMKFKKKYKL